MAQSSCGNRCFPFHDGRWRDASVRRLDSMESKVPVTPKPSKVEAVKIASQYLKVHLAGEVNNGLSHFTEDAATVLKFHGSYQQDDRDHRTVLKREGKE